jgi:hypothetical protein
MSLKITGNTVINNSRNLSITGVTTVGVGTQIITIDSEAVTIGTGITFNIGSQDIIMSGIFTSGGPIPLAPTITSFNPGAGTTDIAASVLGAGVTFVFNYPMDVVSGATTTVVWQYESVPGIRTAFESVGVGSTSIEFSSDSLCVTFKIGYPIDTKNSCIYPVIPNGFFCALGFGCYPGLNTVGAAQTYSIKRRGDLVPGQLYEGGYVICVDTVSACAWVVAPPSAELGRDWFSRGDASTCAQTVTGYSGWFIASSTQWQNPGYSCRTNWPFNPGTYWTNTQLPSQGTEAYYINMSTGTLGSCQPNDQAYSGPGNAGTPVGRNVRSFRCVSY